ncbi:hypothetical protein Cenrod_2359 [Candidatus Symbiobacter mobilis CR]|uniref:Uncharacterized protein n=2 Tax=Candidatus Symbiobacter TaxID=1436289 RepID=U5NDX5_9BURK|nr:hypothetical protein Cenrod_2359 [Candidatus Symbiobacter mobilis CR]
MNSTEKGFLTFMRNELNMGQIFSESYFENASKSMEKFKEGQASCPA